MVNNNEKIDDFPEDRKRSSCNYFLKLKQKKKKLPVVMYSA